MQYQLVIAHRVCPILANTAALYNDKLKMVTDTTLSLAHALRGIKTKLIVILDGCNDKYEKLFDSVFANRRIDGVDYERISTPSIGNCGTYAEQYRRCLPYLQSAEYFYFSEDDYIYKKEAFHAMMDFIQNSDVDFVTPLDHPDRYSHIVPECVRVEVRVSDYCHWREVGTTCCTFMTKKDVFMKASYGLLSYANGAGDGGMWLYLTRDSVFKLSSTIGAMINYLMGRRKTKEGLEFCVLAAWRFHKYKLLFGRKYRLWGPCPSLAVHLCKPSLPPLYGRIMAGQPVLS